MSSSSIRGLGFVALLLAAGSASVAQAQPVAAVRIDDGFTWIRLADNPRFGSEPRNEGWHPIASLRAVGAFASGDALKMVVRQGNRALARAQCQPTNQYGSTLVCGNAGSDWTGGEPMLTVTGELLLDVLHVNGQTDAETLLRTYKFKVEQVTRVNEGNFTPMPPLYVVNAEARTLDAILISETPGHASPGQLHLLGVVSTTDMASALSSASGSLRCSVDGQPLAIPNDQVTSRQGENSYADGSSRPRSGNVRVAQPRDWRQLNWALPINYGPESGGQRASLEEHPGVWLCEIRGNGQTIRAFRFTVRDGAVQAHPEEAQGLSLDPSEHLAEYWIPNAALSNEVPVVAAAVRAGGFYGHAWMSPAARDNAANAARAPAFAAAAGAVAAAGAAPTAGAAAGPVPVRYDDGFAWFELGNNVEPVNGSPTNLGWKLQANLRAYGTAPQRSAFRLVLKQGSRALGEARCEAHESGLNFVDYVEVSDCGQRDDQGVGGPMRISATGAIQVEVHFVDGVTSQDTLLRTHTIEVLAATGIRGNGEPDATNYYISHNAEVLATLIEASEHSSLLPGGASRAGRVGISFQLSPTEAGITTLGDNDDTLRCRVNDQPIVLPRTQQTADRTMSTAVEHTRPDPASSANPIREMVRYQRYALELPINVGAESSTLGIALRSQPGNWACDWRSNGHTLRTFKWTVGADGAIAPSAEEASGLSLAPNAHLIETVVPADSAVDQRVVPAAARAGAFYGRAWTSPAMSAMAAALPTIGTPAPPQPTGRPGAATAGRRGRGH